MVPVEETDKCPRYKLPDRRVAPLQVLEDTDERSTEKQTVGGVLVVIRVVYAARLIAVIVEHQEEVGCANSVT